MKSYHAKSPFFVGMDVHKRTIAVCVYDPNRRIMFDERELPHDLPKVRKHLHRIRQHSPELRCCYEASSCGYGLYRDLQGEEGITCEVIAPSSIPRRSGDRIKTDRRDARKLATLYAGDLLTAICVPGKEQEELRALVRCRASHVDSITRLKQQILAFLQLRGFAYGTGTHWTKTFRTWVCGLPMSEVDQITLNSSWFQLTQLEQQVLQLETKLAEMVDTDLYRTQVRTLMAFRGISLVTAFTLVAELGDLRRFAHPRQLMGYLGLVPSEHSSGEHTRRGGITKTGNGHVRKALVSVAWKYAYPPRCSATLRERQSIVSAEVVAIAQKAQNRLYKRFRTLAETKSRCTANTAVARELVGFLWQALHLKNPLIQTT